MPEPRPGKTLVSEGWPHLIRSQGRKRIPSSAAPATGFKGPTAVSGQTDSEREGTGEGRAPSGPGDTRPEQTDEEEKGESRGARALQAEAHKGRGEQGEREDGRLASGQGSQRRGAGQDPRPAPLAVRPKAAASPVATPARGGAPAPAHRPQRPLTRPARPTIPGRGGAPRPTRRRHRGLGARRQPPTAAPLRRQPLRRLRGTRGGAGSRRVRPEERHPAPALRAPLLPCAPCRPEDHARRAERFPLQPRGVAMAKGCDATDPGAWH